MKRVWLALLILIAPSLNAQSLLYRGPNMGGTWVADGGVVQFNFLHRFYVAPGPSHTVINYPNFTLAAGFGHGVEFGGRFATKSLVGIGANAQSTNETEMFARWRPVGTEGSEGFSLSLTPAYNLLAKSVDGEVAVDWTHGWLTLQGAGRGVSRELGRIGEHQVALAGGVIARFTQYIGVSADLGSFVAPVNNRAAWSVALNVLIPGSPHTFSFQASNATSSTIQGASVGFAPSGSNQILYGFEFTIPIHLKRFAPWFHGRPKSVTLGAPAGTPFAAEIRISSLKFATDTVRIAAGQSVRWVNGDPVEHTVTFEVAPGSPLIPPNASFIHRFDKPGTYSYHCTPHPFMTGVIIVR
ncbi:MAG TPA: cupredoxin family copper-binding protein [Gemmatimonadales bacterium]|nr:cupredoxin family copper-binding protein [Gemmatimonadales bacterium]